MQTVALALARGYWPGKAAFKSNEMGVVLKTEEVNDLSNFTESYFSRLQDLAFETRFARGVL